MAADMGPGFISRSSRTGERRSAGPRHLLVDGLVYEIPEPATLALLDIGGVYLLRRRAAARP